MATKAASIKPPDAYLFDKLVLSSRIKDKELTCTGALGIFGSQHFFVLLNGVSDTLT